MSLHIVLGYGSAEKSAPPFLVYAGPNGTAAQDAKSQATHAARFEEFHHVRGLAKRNLNFNPSVLPPIAEAASETPVVETSTTRTRPRR